MMTDTAGQTLEEKCEALIRSLAEIGKGVDGTVHPAFARALASLNSDGSAPEIVRDMAATVFAWAEAMETAITDPVFGKRTLSVDLYHQKEWKTVLLAEDILSILIDDSAIKAPRNWEDFNRHMYAQKRSLATFESRHQRGYPGSPSRSID